MTAWIISTFTVIIVYFLDKWENEYIKSIFDWVPIASMANVGGIATAPAVTAAYEKKWMPHAIILAILSMASGTFGGMLTIYLFKNFII